MWEQKSTSSAVLLILCRPHGSVYQTPTQRTTASHNFKTSVFINERILYNSQAKIINCQGHRKPCHGNTKQVDPKQPQYNEYSRQTQQNIFLLPPSALTSKCPLQKLVFYVITKWPPECPVWMTHRVILKSYLSGSATKPVFRFPTQAVAALTRLWICTGRTQEGDPGLSHIVFFLSRLVYLFIYLSSSPCFRESLGIFDEVWQRQGLVSPTMCERTRSRAHTHTHSTFQCFLDARTTIV